MVTRSKVENFRHALDQAREFQQIYGNPEMDGVINQLINTYNIDFPRDEMPNLAKAIKKYCYPTRSKCPICGKTMRQRTNRKTGGAFLGCSQYPLCQGSRDIDGNITINKYLEDFINSKLQKGAIPTVGQSRFDMIDEE